MLMDEAVRMVVADTQENTDPHMSPREAVESARSIDFAEDVVPTTEPGELREAYRMVLGADQWEIDLLV